MSDSEPGQELPKITVLFGPISANEDITMAAGELLALLPIEDVEGGLEAAGAAF